MKKILFIGSDPRNIGGIETFGRNLKKILGENLYFFAYERNPKVLYEVEDVFCYSKKKYQPKFLRKNIQNYIEKKHLNEVVKKINPDIFILNTPQDLKLLENISGKKILVQHQTAETYWERDSYLNKDENLLEKLKKEVDMIVTLSKYDEEEFIEKFKINKNKITNIRHLSEINILEQKKEKNKNLIMICRLANHHKRIDLAIKSMKNLSEYTLNIFGDGTNSEKEMLKKLVGKYKLENVNFCGVTNKVKDKLDENSIFVMTSDYEGYPLTVIEAMRRGLPLIVRNTFTSAKDIIEENGILLEENWNEEKFVEGIRKIYTNYEQYSKESTKLGERHSYKEISREWKKLIKNL